MRGLAVLAAIFVAVAPVASKSAQSPELADLLTNYERLFKSGDPQCKRQAETDEIIVCAKNQEHFRLPIREPRTADGSRRSTGASNDIPGPPCPPRGCPGGATFAEAVGNLVKLGKAIVGADGDD